MTIDEARGRADKIRAGLRETWKLIKEAYEKRDDKALGYPTWDAYCKAEFGTCYLRVPREELPEIVRSMSLTMGGRKIASALGISEATVRRAKGASNDAPTPAGPKPTPKPDVYIAQFQEQMKAFTDAAIRIQNLCKDRRFGLHREALVKKQGAQVMYAHDLTKRLVPYFADPGVTLLDEQDGAA